MGDDTVVLTEREREVLAQLAAGLDDPWLSLQLTGAADAPPPPSPADRSAGGPAEGMAWLRRWAAVMLLVAGAVVSVLAFGRWLPVALAGLAVTAATGLIVWHDARRGPSRSAGPSR